MNAPDGRPTNAVFGFISMFIKMIEVLHPDAVICAFDKGKPAFRMEALEKYKAHRPPTDPLLKPQFPIIKELLEAMDVPVVELDGWEGDDILGTLAQRGSAKGMEILLVTGDRDAFQLVDHNVKVVTTKKGISDVVVYGPDEVFERYGVTVAQVPDYLGLKGDPSDNIPGVPGVGEKTAAKLLQEYGTLEEIVAHAGDIKGKMGERIRENSDAAFASRIVATIACDVPVEVDLESVRFPSFEPADVRKAFGELGFKAHLGKVLSFAPSPDSSAAPVTGDEPSLAVGIPMRGPAAAALVDEAVAAGEWLGVAIDDGAGSSLFGDTKELFVAAALGIAAFDSEEIGSVLSALLRGANVAAFDTKALIQEVVPADSALPALVSIVDLDASRLFDLSVAAYLLDSSRSSYDLFALCDRHLGVIMPEATDAIPVGAVSAAALHALRPRIDDELERDGSRPCFVDIEMPLVPVLVEMERVGVGLDTSVLSGLSATTAESIELLREEIYELAGGEFVIDSPKQLATVLFERLGLPTKRKTKTGFSTDAAVLSELAPLHPLPEKVVAYRELAKLRSTYIDALPRLLATDGRLHTTYNQTVAATGRLSSSNPNLQNIPVRTEFGRRIRAAFVADHEGDVMVAADYSQIELRLLAHLSGDQGLIDAFTSGEDFHTATAARVFGVHPDDVTTELRSRAKAVNFGIVYGQQAFGLSTSLGISYAEAQTMIDRYYAAYPMVREFLDETVAQAHRDGWAITMWGRKRHIHELTSSNPNLRSFGERTAMNHPMQGSAADIIKLAMIEVEKRLHAEGFRAEMVLQVHDELVFECPVEESEALAAMAVEVMSGVADLHVPLDVSATIATNWAEAK